MDYKCEEEKAKICENNSKCYLCDGERLYREPKWMERQKKERARKLNKVPKKKKEGMDFEKKVVKIRDKKMLRPSSSRRPGSGCIWSMPGDIVSEEDLIECKERGSCTSKGESTISIPKSHLDKVKEEAYMAKKERWYYVFRYKNHDEVYLVKDFEDELDLIQQNKMLRERILELERNTNEN